MNRARRLRKSRLMKGVETDGEREREHRMKDGKKSGQSYKYKYTYIYINIQSKTILYCCVCVNASIDEHFSNLKNIPKLGDFSIGKV